MANVYQQAVKRRKLSYLAAIGVLLLASLVVRGTFTGVDRKPVDDVAASPIASLTIDGRARVHELTELQQGDKELGGAAVQLLLTGSRGFAVSALWLNAIEKQKKQEWNELDISVNSITKLQPHFTAPWLFQSWNLAYNVSVEMDRLNDMYFYIARGISVIAEGESLNRNNPDLRYNVGFYYQNKFGVSDRVTTLRCLYQLSCIPDEERNPDRLVTVNPADGSRVVDLVAFEDFCKKNPQLIRRMREARIPVDGKPDQSQHLATEPAAVVAFLRANQKVPSRYEANGRDLKPRLKQFPVLPELAGQPINTDELRYNEHLADHLSDAFVAARGWFALANCAIPPPNPLPIHDGLYNPDPLKYRIPKRPATIIFRQGPPRAQTYHAERMTKEAWFDRTPWIMDEGVDEAAVWLPDKDGKRRLIAFPTPDSALAAWVECATRWQEHGKANGLRIDPADLQKFITLAEEFCKRRPELYVGAVTPPLTIEESRDPEIVRQHEAHRAVTGWQTNRGMTQFESFELEAVALQTEQAMLAKRKFHQAAKALRDNSQYSEAAKLYEEGFALWKQVLVARQECRARRSTDPAVMTQACRDFRDLDRHQEDAYEINLRYARLLGDVNQQALRESTMWVHDLLYLAGNGASGNPFQAVGALNVLASEGVVPGPNPGDPPSNQTRFVPLLSIAPLALPGPLDGLAPDETPWIKPEVKNKIREKLGLVKRTEAPPTPPAGGPPPGGPPIDFKPIASPPSK